MRWTLAMVLVVQLTATFIPTGGAQAQDVTIFAAASVKTALDEIASGFEAETAIKPAISYAGTSVLARQILLGAPADVFVSASTDWMDWLAERQAIEETSRFDLLTNQLVLIAHDASDEISVLSTPALENLVQGNRIAMALVAAVPAGIYAKSALEHYGLWTPLESQVVQTDNARAALALVALGEVPFGIVYASDAVADQRVHVIARFPAESHADIRYPVAIIQNGNGDTAEAFLRYLRTSPAKLAFANNGFGVLEPPS